jgi:hypothetical protein
MIKLMLVMMELVILIILEVHANDRAPLSFAPSSLTTSIYPSKCLFTILFIHLFVLLLVLIYYRCDILTSNSNLKHSPFIIHLHKCMVSLLYVNQ